MSCRTRAHVRYDAFELRLSGVKRPRQPRSRRRNSGREDFIFARLALVPDINIFSKSPPGAQYTKAMRLPRRTPFADAKREIPQLYSLLYPPQSLSLDEAREARAKGIELVHDVYLVRSGGNTCPVAIECTTSLLSALTLDLDASATARTAAASLAVRQSLSLALIRLVNSLVDSLQSGAFARSIAHIAEQDLKLPLWLVEFRHRATHEGLPGLQNCREAVAAVS